MSRGFLFSAHFSASFFLHIWNLAKKVPKSREDFTMLLNDYTFCEHQSTRIFRAAGERRLSKMWLSRGGVVMAALRSQTPGLRWHAGTIPPIARLPCSAAPTIASASRPASLRSLSMTASRHNSDASQDHDEEEMKERRRWVASFSDLSLRRSDFSVTFSRSSGPGGQNVNKLNTKANVRLDLSQTSSHAPDSLDPAHPRKWLTRDLVSRIAKKSPYYVASDHSLLVTSMRHRTQEANVQDALEKLHAHLLELAGEGLVGETSKEQRERVRRLENAEKARKKQNKVKRADVKSGRKFKG